MATQPSPAGLLLSADLLFASRVTATAAPLGLRVEVARSVPELKDKAREHPRCVILDLDYRELDLAGLIGWLRQECSPMPLVVAYGPHVDSPGLHAAQQAGCDVVMPRGAFVRELPARLPQWLAWPEPGGGP